METAPTIIPPLDTLEDNIIDACVAAQWAAQDLYDRGRPDLGATARFIQERLTEALDLVHGLKQDDPDHEDMPDLPY